MCILHAFYVQVVGFLIIRHINKFITKSARSSCTQVDDRHDLPLNLTSKTIYYSRCLDAQDFNNNPV